MGQSGMELGLALYEDLACLQALLSGQFSDEQAARQSSAISVTYGEKFDIATQDLDVAERYGWPVAGPEAYPSVFRVNPGLALRGPLQWELELLEGCLRAIPEFIAQASGVQSSGVTDVSVSLANGPMTLQLAWLGEEDTAV